MFKVPHPEGTRNKSKSTPNSFPSVGKLEVVVQ